MAISRSSGWEERAGVIPDMRADAIGDEGGTDRKFVALGWDG